MAKYDEFKSLKNPGRSVLVEAAKRDGSGKNIENNYAKQNGYYQGFTAGLADNLTPYSEDSGAEQENPFISNGTGTNNNTEIVTVGDYGLFKEKQGNTVVVNQLVQNGNDSFNIGTGTLTCTKRGQTLILNGEYAAGGSTQAQFALYRPIYNHKYLVYISKDVTGYASIQVNDWNASGEPLGRTYVKPSIFTSTNATNQKGGQYGIGIYINPNRVDPIVYDNYSFNVYIIDLTQWFNGDIPADIIANPDHFSWYYNGDLSYNTGSLENADGVKLVSTKRNIYNPNETYNVVIPNKPFFASKTTTITYYDKDKNVISTENVSAGNTFTTPSNCVFINSSVSAITITPYYTPEEGGEGYLDSNNVPIEYPYEEPYTVDTGNEVLRQAGSVKDTKDPDGTIHRLVGYVDLSQYQSDIYYVEGTNCWEANLANMGLPIAKANGNVGIPNIIWSEGTNVTYWFDSAKGDAGKITVRPSNGLLELGTGSVTIKPTGIVFYELATPTTEQGTTFAENLPINDYGMLYWLDSSNNLVGVPQGAKIFYPVNYKGFIDDVYARTDGDAGKLVIQEERTADKTELQGVDTQLKNAIGGTLRQCLCVKESLDFEDTEFVDLGDFEWDYENANQYFRITLNYIKPAGSNNTVAKILCTKYKSDTWNNTAPSTGQNKRIAINGTSSIVSIKDTAYTDPVAFKNAMKGVLLAYEKESS